MGSYLLGILVIETPGNIQEVKEEREEKNVGEQLEIIRQSLSRYARRTNS